MYCDLCGVPQGISRGNAWYADGTIFGKYPPYIKATFFDADELGFLFHSLSAYMEYDIGDMVAGGKYHDTREYMTAMVEKMKESSGGKLPPAADLYRMMLYPISVWGIAEVEFVSAGEDMMVIHVRQPYSVDLLRGDVAAVADVVTGREHAASWEGDEQEGVMTVVPTRGGSEASRRIDEEQQYDVKPEAEELACERCEACGTPARVPELFRWEKGGCRIEEVSSGRRYCFNNTQGITSVLGMLVEELGQDVELKMEEMARDYSRTLYEGREALSMEAEFDGFPYRGWGKVAEFSAAADGLSVTVENPYNETLITGRIWGMGEASAGESLRMTSRMAGRGVLRLTFKP